MLMPMIRTDIDACVRHCGRVDLEVLFAFGWSLEELLHAPHPETRRKAEAYAKRLDLLDRSACGFALVIFVVAMIWCALAIAAHPPLPGV